MAHTHSVNFRENHYIVATSKFYFDWGSAPDPTGVSYCASPDPQLDLREPTSEERGEEREEKRRRVDRQTDRRDRRG